MGVMGASIVQAAAHQVLKEGGELTMQDSRTGIYRELIER